MDSALQRSYTISIANLKSFTMSGVHDIAGFDGEYILLETSLGKISIEGNELKIESLSKENGEIFITGDISGVYATPEREKKVGFFGKLFG